MRFLVLGAGAVGGYFGGRLVEAGADVSFLVRPGRAQRLAAAGLRIASAEGDATLHPKLVVAGEAAADEAGFDCALLACKAYDLDAAISALRPHVGAATTVLPLLNGLRHLETLDRAFGDRQTIGGLCQISATLDSDGTIRHLGIPPRLLFGERAGGRSSRIDALVDALKDVRFEAIASDSIMQDMWEKFALLASLAGITCLMRAPVGIVASSPGGEAFARQMVEDCVSVATAAGHAPRPSFLDRLVRMMTDPASALAASMLRDVEAGGASEGDHVLGDLHRRGVAAGFDLPALSMAALNLAVYERRRSAGRQAGQR